MKQLILICVCLSQCLLTTLNTSFLRHLSNFRTSQIQNVLWYICQWVETNLSNIHIFPTDIRFYLPSWYYANGFCGLHMLNTDVCRC